MTLLLALAWASAVGAIVTWHALVKHKEDLPRGERVIRNVRWPG